MRSISRTALILGALIMLVPFLGDPDVLLWHNWNNWTIGALVVLLSLVNATGAGRRGEGSAAFGVLLLSFGVWLVVGTPLVSRTDTPDVHLIANVVLGAALVATATWSLLAGARAGHRRVRQPE